MDRIAELRRQGKLQEALDGLEQLEQPHPLERANLLARLGRPQEALQCLQQLDFLSDYGLALKGGLLEHLGQAAESEALFEELSQRPHLGPAAWQRVMKYLEQRDPERAARWAERSPRPNADQLQRQAQALVKAKQEEAALELLERSHEHFPGHPGLLRDLVMLKLKGEPPEVVVEELDTLLSLQDHAHNAALRERLVQALRDLKDFERARQELLLCLRQSGNQHYLRANLAYVLRDMGRIEEALDLMEELLRENPADPFVLGAYCKACREHELVDRAGAFIGMEAQKDPARRRWWGTYRKVCK